MEKSIYTISGTEIGAILGLNRYMTPMDLYMRKLGLIDPEPENEAMKWGSAAEHVVARRYARETGQELIPSIDKGYDYKNPLIHPEYDWWSGTPDRKIKAPLDGLLEIKIVGERMAHQWGEPPDGDVPEQYLTQVAWYMPLLGVEWADLAVQIGNKDYRVYRINRDREFENQLRDAALEFINNHLIPQIPPPIDGSESSKRWLTHRYPKDLEPILETDSAEIMLLLKEYREVKRTLSNIQEHESLLVNQFKNLTGDHLGIQTPMGKILWKKNKDSQSLDYKAMAAAYPDIAAKFMKFKPGSRVFRVYIKEDL